MGAGAVAVLAATVSVASANWFASLDEAHRQFYSGRYDAAAALALDVRTQHPDNLAASELRTSALHFQIRRALGEPQDREQAWARCSTCQHLFPMLMAEIAAGQATARTRLQQHPQDIDALFFLGKLNLTFVWVQLGTVGRRTGWAEYWEARRSLDAVLDRDPGHVRARVARAWIDYIIDTRLPRGTRWMLGGGSRKKGLRMMAEAARSPAEPFVQAEAMFALWDMQIRERNIAGAVVTARALARNFPDNPDLGRFLAAHDSRPNFTSAAAR